MPKKRRNKLAEALQSNRDLQNQLHGIEWPLQKRIRELEVERDTLVVKANVLEAENRTYADLVPPLLALLQRQLSSGKTR